MLIRTLAALLILVGFGAPPIILRAATPVFWTVATQADFLRGEVEHVSIDSDGRLVLGSMLERVADPATAAIWAGVTAPDGTIYLGSGHEGRVYRVGVDGRLSVVLDTDELEVHALAQAPDGSLYVATSPDGRIYRVAPSGSSSVFFDPEDKYIWSLVTAPDGTIYAATGDKGVIYQISPSGQGKPFYSTKSTNVMCLAFDREGRLLAGTQSPGRVIRIDRNGRGFVLLDSPFDEVRALRVDEKGVVFAAAIGARPEGPRAGAPTQEPAQPAVVPSVSTEISAIAIIDTGSGSRQTGSAPRSESQGPSKGGVYRILPDGLWDVRWESTEDQPHDLSIDRDGALTIGTGNSGKIFRVAGEPAVISLVGRVEAQQITRFHSERDGHLAILTANPGRLLRLTTGRAPRGTYLSEVRDAGTIATWGTLRWRANGGGRVELYTRSGNTKPPDETWSDWSGPHGSAAGEQIRSPNARYIQWRAVLIASEQAGVDAPVLTSVTVAFLPRNLSPVVSGITVHPPGTVFQRPFPTSDQVEVAGFEATPVDGRPGQPPAPAVGGAAAPTAPVGRRLYQKGLQTFTWSARDANDDTLQYDVLYRREGDASWKPLKRALWDAIVVWDTTSVPDGSYTVKVVATDTAANAPATALAGEAESTAFDVDNTSPRIQVSNPVRSASGATVTFIVRDDHSAIRRVEYSLDGDRWRILYPKDGIPDSRVEEFDLILEGDAALRSVIIRATDAMNNVATAVAGR